MTNALKAAVAAACLFTVASPASAAIVYSESGIDTWGASTVFDAAPGRYRMTITTDRPLQLRASAHYWYTWRSFIAPAPRPLSELVDGYETEGGGGKSAISSRRLDFEFIIPKDYITYFEGYYDGIYGIPWGTPMYKVHSHTERTLTLSVLDLGDWSEDPEPFSYSFTISAIPEPATWALMIAGFGLAGTARRRRGTIALAA